MTPLVACTLIAAIGAVESVVHLMRIRAAHAGPPVSAGWAAAIAGTRVVSIAVVAIGAQDAAGFVGLALVYPVAVFASTFVLQSKLNEGGK